MSEIWNRCTSRHTVDILTKKCQIWIEEEAKWKLRYTYTLYLKLNLRFCSRSSRSSRHGSSPSSSKRPAPAMAAESLAISIPRHVPPAPPAPPTWTCGWLYIGLQVGLDFKYFDVFKILQDTSRYFDRFHMKLSLWQVPKWAIIECPDMADLADLADIFQPKGPESWSWRGARRIATGYDRLRQATTGYDRLRQATTGYDRLRQATTGYDRLRQATTGYDRLRQATTGYDRLRQATTGYDRLRQATTGYDRLVEMDFLWVLQSNCTQSQWLQSVSCSSDSSDCRTQWQFPPVRSFPELPVPSISTRSSAKKSQVLKQAAASVFPWHSRTSKQKTEQASQT